MRLDMVEDTDRRRSDEDAKPCRPWRLARWALRGEEEAACEVGDEAGEARRKLARLAGDDPRRQSASESRPCRRRTGDKHIAVGPPGGSNCPISPFPARSLRNKKRKERKENKFWDRVATDIVDPDGAPSRARERARSRLLHGGFHTLEVPRTQLLEEEQWTA